MLPQVRPRGKTFQAAAESLAWLFADDIVRYLPPKKSRGHGLRVIREVLAADARASTLERVPGAPRERKGLAGALAYLGLIQRRRAVVFLVSDFLDIEGVEREVRALVQRHDLIPLHLRDPLDLAMPPLGTALAEDPECRERRLFLPFGFKSFRRRYTAAVQAQIASVEHLFHHAGTDIVPVDLGESPVRPLARYFRLRTRRQG